MILRERAERFHMRRIPDVVVGRPVPELVRVDLLSLYGISFPRTISTPKCPTRGVCTHLEPRGRQLAIFVFLSDHFQPVVICLHIPIANDRLMSTRVWQPVCSGPAVLVSWYVAEGSSGMVD
jgi:hypothetical protein